MEHYVIGVSRVALSPCCSRNEVGLIRGTCLVVPFGCLGVEATGHRHRTGSVRWLPECRESILWRLVRGREELPAAAVPGAAFLPCREGHATNHTVHTEVHLTGNNLQPMGSIVRKGSGHAFDLQHDHEADGVGLGGGNYATIGERGVQSTAAAGGCQRGCKSWWYESTSVVPGNGDSIGPQYRRRRCGTGTTGPE